MAINKIALSGQMGAGKDHIADILVRDFGFYKISFSDALHKIGKYFFGQFADKSFPEYRSFLQQLGQWGRGLHDERHPLSVERAIITKQIQSEGAKIAGGEFHMIRWSEYGTNPNFWVNALVARVQYLTKSWKWSGDPKIVVTSVRFENELTALVDLGFRHFHVIASDEARAERLGEGFNPYAEAHNSESLSKRLNSTHPPTLTIWSDTDEALQRSGYLHNGYQTVDSFIRFFNITHYDCRYAEQIFAQA